MILQIETATQSCSVALAHNGKLLFVKELSGRNVHAESITMFIDELMRMAGIRYQDIDAVAVSCGPGSYTGLRIGVSTAKGLCFAIDKPLIAVNTLAAMAAGLTDRYQDVTRPGQLLCPMIDARRMEVYTAVYSRQGEMIKEVAAEIIEETSFAELLQAHPLMFFGDGAEKCRRLLGQNPNAYFLPAFSNSAADLTGPAFEKFTQNDFVDVAYFEPFYLKDFIAGKKKSDA